MTINEAIQKLSELEKEVGGDVEIISMQEVDGRFFMEWGRIFDLIEVPDEDGNEITLVCALMDDPETEN